jgi:hypothetical protein
VSAGLKASTKPQIAVARSKLSTSFIAARMNLWKSYSEPSEHVTKYKQTSPGFGRYLRFKDSVRVSRGFRTI